MGQVKGASRRAKTTAKREVAVKPDTSGLVGADDAPEAKEQTLTLPPGEAGRVPPAPDEGSPRLPSARPGDGRPGAPQMGEGKEGGEAAAKGPDNNKRLALLEGRTAALGDNLGALGITANPGEDVFDLALRAIVTRAGQLDAASAERAALLAALHERGSPPGPEESAVGCAIRLLAEQAAKPAARSMFEPRPAAFEQVALVADLPATAAITLRFGEGDALSGAVPPRAVERGELRAAGERAVLEAAIDFGPELPPATIDAAWLIAGQSRVKCEIPGGIRVGGGARARIPAGHLIF